MFPDVIIAFDIVPFVIIAFVMFPVDILALLIVPFVIIAFVNLLFVDTRSVRIKVLVVYTFSKGLFVAPIFTSFARGSIIVSILVLFKMALFAPDKFALNILITFYIEFN
jgi:hypothetical protein